MPAAVTGAFMLALHCRKIMSKYQCDSCHPCHFSSYSPVIPQPASFSKLDSTYYLDSLYHSSSVSLLGSEALAGILPARIHLPVRLFDRIFTPKTTSWFIRILKGLLASGFASMYYFSSSGYVPKLCGFVKLGRAFDKAVASNSG